jgi:WD40 repeat protein
MNIDSSSIRQIAKYEHSVPLSFCAFDAGGRFVLAGGRDRDLLCLNVAAEATSILEGHASWVSAIVPAGEGLVLSADFSGHVIAWDCSGDAPRPRWERSAHPVTIQALAVSADSQLLATGDRDGLIRLWSPHDGEPVQDLARLEHPVTGLAFHPDGHWLVSADRQPQKPRLKVWERETGREQRSIEVADLSAYRRVEDIEWGSIRAVTCSPDGGTLLACGRNGYSGPAAALLFDFQTGEQSRQLSSSLKGICYAAKFHPEGFLLTASGDVGKGEIQVWNIEMDEALATHAAPGPCTALDLDPTARRLALTQMRGRGSYPDSGSLTLLEFVDSEVSGERQ